MAFERMQGPVAIRGRMARPEDALALLGFLECFLWRRDVGATLWAEPVARHLRAGSLRGGMIEEIHGQDNGSIVLSAVGFSAFVTDRAVAALMEAGRPEGALDMLGRVCSGEDGLLLKEAEIAAANGGEGLNLMVLGFAHRYENPDDPNCRALLARAIAHFVEAHSGFNLRQIVREDPEPVAGVLISSGMREVARYPLPGVEFVVMHRRRDDDLPLFPDSITAQLMAHSPPIIRFSAAQRALLELACDAMTDDDIAETLGLSINTVKRTWKLIYDRVADRAPQIMMGRGLGHGSSPGRGTEKRRHLISYLKQHPQELRPIADRAVPQGTGPF